MAITEELKNAIKRIEYKTRVFDAPDHEQMNLYIRAWCHELDWAFDEAIVEHAQEFKGSFLKVLLDTTGLKKRRVRKALKDLKKNMDTTAHILIALGLAGAGYATYTLKQRRSEQPTLSPQQVRPAPKPAEVWKLILVINAKHQALVERIQSQGLSSVQKNELFEATQALWMGRESALRANHELSRWLTSNDDNTSDPTNHSEYDVHLVEVRLSKDDSGLHPEASALERLDAFERILANHTDVRMTQRLPSAAYGKTGVYQK